jgi:putative DNA primase/helicase
MRYILLDNQDEYDFLQRWFGRSLSAMSPSDNDRILMEIGQGANGKTKTNEAIARLLGDYAAPTDFGTWCANNNGGSPPRADLVKLAGKRLVITSEPSGDHVLDESVLKQYTGGEMVTPRAMYARTETVYRPEFALVIGTNHEPVMKDTSSGFWRRFKKMVFARNIPEEEWDTDFEAKVEKELSGILNWLIGGNRSWREKGLLPPESVRLSTAESREDADLTQQFIDETFVISMDSDVKYQQALKTYQVWAEAGGISGKQRLNRSNFSKAMREHGIAIEMSGDHENVKVLRHLAYRRFLVGE